MSKDLHTGQKRAADGVIRVNALPNMTKYVAANNEKLYRDQVEHDNPTIYNGEKFNCSDFAKMSVNIIPGFYEVSGTENVKVSSNGLVQPISYDRNVTTPNFLFRSLKKALQAGPARGAVLKQNSRQNKDFINGKTKDYVSDETPGR